MYASIVSDLYAHSWKKDFTLNFLKDQYELA